MFEPQRKKASVNMRNYHQRVEVVGRAEEAGGARGAIREEQPSPAVVRVVVSARLLRFPRLMHADGQAHIARMRFCGSCMPSSPRCPESPVPGTVFLRSGSFPQGEAALLAVLLSGAPPRPRSLPTSHVVHALFVPSSRCRADCNLHQAFYPPNQCEKTNLTRLIYPSTSHDPSPPPPPAFPRAPKVWCSPTRPRKNASRRTHNFFFLFATENAPMRPPTHPCAPPPLCITPALTKNVRPLPQHFCHCLR